MHFYLSSTKNDTKNKTHCSEISLCEKLLQFGSHTKSSSQSPLWAGKDWVREAQGWPVYQGLQWSEVSPTEKAGVWVVREVCPLNISLSPWQAQWEGEERFGHSLLSRTRCAMTSQDENCLSHVVLSICCASMWKLRGILIEFQAVGVSAFVDKNKSKWNLVDILTTDTHGCLFRQQQILWVFCLKMQTKFWI